MSETAVEVLEVSKSIVSGSRTVHILHGITFRIAKGEIVAIMGASGSGKTTLLGLMAGLDSVTAGKILLDGTDITGFSEDELAPIRGRKIGFVFQSYQLVPSLTAEENVLLPAELAGIKGDLRARARDLLARVGLEDRRTHYPVQLSGGEQQRVALARAFMTSPPIIMADEPTGNLDSVNGEHVLSLLLDLNREAKTTLIMVTHDAVLASKAGRKIVLRDGRIVTE